MALTARCTARVVSKGLRTGVREVTCNEHDHTSVAAIAARSPTTGITSRAAVPTTTALLTILSAASGATFAAFLAITAAAATATASALGRERYEHVERLRFNLHRAPVSAVLSVRARSTIGTLTASSTALCAAIIYPVAIRISSPTTGASRLRKGWYWITFGPTFAICFDIDLHLRSRCSKTDAPRRLARWHHDVLRVHERRNLVRPDSHVASSLQQLAGSMYPDIPSEKRLQAAVCG